MDDDPYADYRFPLATAAPAPLKNYYRMRGGQALDRMPGRPAPPPGPHDTADDRTGYHHADRPFARYSGRKAGRLRRAVVEMLVGSERETGILWTHKVDQTFAASLGPRTAAFIRVRYGERLALLPTLLAPVSAWMIIERHPHGTGCHMHGIWKAPQAAGIPEWWRAVKEWFWTCTGSCRLWKMSGTPTVADRMEALEYPLKHAVKGSPTTFLRKATWYTRAVQASGDVVVRWRYRGRRWRATRPAAGDVYTEKGM